MPEHPIHETHWLDLHTPDPAAALAFYQRLYGWQAKEYIHPGGTYTMLCTAAGRPFGGIHHGAQPQWIPHITVPGLAAAIQAALAAGATLVSPPESIGHTGTVAQLRDPQGAPFALHECPP